MATATTRPPRTSVPIEQTWDLEGLYPDTAAWDADMDRVDKLLPAIMAYKGRLDEGARVLCDALQLCDRVNEIARRVVWYASNRLSEDQDDPARQGLNDRATALSARVNSAMAFVEPELLALPDGTVEAYLDAEPGLAVYRLYLTDLLEQRAHLLGEEAEEVIAAMTELLAAPVAIFRNTANADLTFDPVVDEHGHEVPMSLAALNRLLQSPDRRVRRDAYDSATRAYAAYRRTLAATFAAAQKRDVILARLRRYPSALAAALAPVHLPEELFHTLLRVAEDGTTHLRRYNTFRRRELGLDRLMPYDLSAPLDPDLEAGIGFGEAFETVLRALDPLGPAYRSVLERAYDERWVDWADNAGKTSGAYSYGNYSYHPVILMTWQGKYDDAFTLAHELGHAVHSTLCTAAQPYVYAGYPLFLAEMASTTNEILLLRHLLATTSDRALRRYVLTRALRSFTSNFYGGASMAALQLEVHRMVERGQPLTYESVTAANTTILTRWYGDTVEVTDEGMGSGWTRATHHYSNFYAYQYATGIAAAAAFADAILTGGRPAVDRYIGFLSAGSSKRPLDILRDAGLDMTGPVPLDRAVNLFAELLDELERT